MDGIDENPFSCNCHFNAVQELEGKERGGPQPTKSTLLIHAVQRVREKETELNSHHDMHKN
jgi:hypothetical protein